MISVQTALAQAGGLWNQKSALFHDLDHLTHRLSLLEEAFPSNTLHAVAIKANPLVEVLRTIVEAGFGLEAASWEEVQLALAAGCDAKKIVFDSPAKTTGELKAALALPLTLNVDNVGELERLAALNAPQKARIGLRVNPQIGDGSISFTSTVGKSSKFGVPLSQAPALFERFRFLTGLHVHTGSQGCGLALLAEAALATGEVAKALHCQFIDIGGGVPVRYTSADSTPPTYKMWADAVSSLAESGMQIVTEVGRSVHSSAGFALSVVEGTKIIDGHQTLIIHFGADLLLRRVYQSQHWDHRFTVLNPDGSEKTGQTVPTQIAGPLCFSGDVLARRRALHPAKPGDLLVIHDTGAYTLSMWSRHCSRGLPPTIGLQGNKARLLHAGESPKDVVAFWSNR